MIVWTIIFCFIGAIAAYFGFLQVAAAFGISAVITLALAIKRPN